MNKRLKKLTDELEFHEIGTVSDKNNIKKNLSIILDKNYVHRKIFKTFAIAFAVIFLLTAAAIAAVLKWDNRMLELFEPSDKMIEQLSGAVNIPVISGENNGVTVTIRQTIADKHGIYVLYDIEAPENFEFNDDIRWEWSHFHIKYKSEDTKPGLIGGASQKIISQNKNKRTVLLYRYGTAEMINQKVKFELSDLGYFDKENEQWEFKPLVECDIFLEWDFTYVDSTKTFEIHKPVKINATCQNIWEILEVSPMSVFIRITGDDILTGIEPIIKFKDGSVIHVKCENNLNSSYSFSNFQNGESKKGVCNVSYRFDNITDLEAIESITVGDVTVPISQDHR